MRRLRLFIDEAGNSDLKGAADDPNVRYLSLNGVMTFQEFHANRFQPELDSLKRTLFGHSPQNPIILHGREIVRREGPFTVLRDPTAQVRFNSEILRLFAELPYLAVTVQIDKKQHLEKYGVWHFDPYHYCLRCIVVAKPFAG